MVLGLRPFLYRPVLGLRPFYYRALIVTQVSLSEIRRLVPDDEAEEARVSREPPSQRGGRWGLRFCWGPNGWIRGVSHEMG